MPCHNTSTILNTYTIHHHHHQLDKTQCNEYQYTSEFKINALITYNLQTIEAL
jgi:hypothetical protein